MVVQAVKAPHKLGQQKWSRTLVCMVVFASMLVSMAAVVMETTVFNVDRHNLLALVPTLMCLALTWRWLRVPLMPVVSLSLLVMLMCYSTMALPGQSQLEQGPLAGCL